MIRFFVDYKSYYIILCVELVNYTFPLTHFVYSIVIGMSDYREAPDSTVAGLPAEVYCISIQ